MTTLRELEGTRWVGLNELWLDPLGNEALVSDGTMRVDANRVAYTWSYEGKAHEGSITLRDGDAEFVDSWHSTKPTPFKQIAGSWSLVEVHGTYDAPEGPPWGWRISVSLRPGGEELVLQMTNVTPWGEDGRAVRMICKRV